MFHILIAALGAWLVWAKDVRNRTDWIGKQGSNGPLLVRLMEPLVEKQNSFKAIAEIEAIIGNDSAKKATGKLILYFKKDSSIRTLTYGSQVLFFSPIQKIRNAGNPGGFDYERYCLFQGITHQAYLTPKDFVQLPQKKVNRFHLFLLKTKTWVLHVIRKNIKESKEQGLAEALLIGYKDDLDKNLVQSYSNTGVVHIIAISGLHLGLIYWLLVRFTKPLKRRKGFSWLRFLLIIAGLWIFSLIAGAQPSILRSAVMFSCIALGELINRKGSIFNTLALSAFILLCINPFWLWDVGFQLSYSAVLSIIIFFRPISNWLFFTNKALDWLWKLNTVTLSAQVLTLPIVLYHFHQFPVLFLVANMVAVPLSSLILIGELILLAFSFIPVFASWIGIVLEKMILFMNRYIERLDSVSFAVWHGFSISIMQVLLLFLFATALSYWLMEKQKQLLKYALVFLLFFIALRSFSFIGVNRQKEIIVYNIPKHQAIDIINGRNSLFLGDGDLVKDDFPRNFHLQPSRIVHRTKTLSLKHDKCFRFANKSIMVLDSSIRFKQGFQKYPIDLLVLSRNPKLYLKDLQQAFQIRQVVIDASVPAWKKKLWIKDCDSLHLPCYDVAEKGAFVMKLQ